MEFPLVILVGALIVALIRRRLSLSLPTWRGGSLLAVALSIQVYFIAFPPTWLTTQLATVIYLGSQSLVASFLLLNRHLSGVWLVAVGLGLNALVVAANGAMPVSSSAVETAGAEALSDPRHVEHGVHLRNEEMTKETHLPLLSDVIPIPPFEKVVSLGDLVLAAGLLWAALSVVEGRAQEGGSSSALPAFRRPTAARRSLPVPGFRRRTISPKSAQHLGRELFGYRSAPTQDRADVRGAYADHTGQVAARQPLLGQEPFYLDAEIVPVHLSLTTKEDDPDLEGGMTVATGPRER